MSEPDFRLHCRECGAGFFDMLEKLNHQDQCGQRAKLRRKQRKARKKGKGQTK